ncbi:MAG: hypothetical protein V4492_08515 [Chlamydiota bacterium]
MKKILSVISTLVLSVNLMGNVIQWSAPPTSLSNTSVNSSNASVAMDSSGNVVAVWLENGAVKASAKLISGGWGTVATLSSSTATSPSIVCDSSGNATAVWLEGGAVKAMTKPFGSAWGSVSTLATTLATTPTIAVDAAGDVIAAWARSGNIQTATKLFGANWQNAVNITSSSATSPAIAMGGTGSGTRAAIVWNAVSSSIPVVYATTKAITGNWGTPVILSNTSHNAINPSVAVDSNANALATWYSYDVLGVNYFSVAVQASYMISGGAWQSPVTISDESYRNPTSLMTKVAFDSGGNAVAMWTSSSDGATYNIEAAMKPVRSDWSTPTQIVSLNPYSYQFSLAGTSFGEALAVLMFYNGDSLLVQSSESDFSGFRDNAWSVPTNMSLGTDNGYPNAAAVITSNAMNAAAVWIKNNGTNNIVYAVTGSKNLLLPPTSLTATQSSNSFGIFTEYYNTFGWTASASSDVTKYLIYRNGMFLAEVDASATQYIDSNRVQSQATTYGVAAVNAQGTVSRIASVNYP